MENGSHAHHTYDLTFIIYDLPTNTIEMYNILQLENTYIII